MIDQALLAAAKMARRISTDAFDAEVSRLLEAAKLDLAIAGVIEPEGADPLYQQAQITYFLANFGSPERYDELKASYDEQKAQLMVATGYTEWTKSSN